MCICNISISLFYPLLEDVDEIDIEQFIKNANITPPLRIEILRYRQNEEKKMDTTDNKNDKRKDMKNIDCNNYGYAYVTFPTTEDCESILKIRRKILKNQIIQIFFSTVPRTDLENQTNFTLLSRKFETKIKIENFLETFRNNFTDSPLYIRPGAGRAAARGDWILTWKNPIVARQAVYNYSGRIFEDNFVILGFTWDPKMPHLYDKQQCFHSITDRVVLHGINRTTNTNEIWSFLQQNHFSEEDVLDIYIVQRITQKIIGSPLPELRRSSSIEFRICYNNISIISIGK